MDFKGCMGIPPELLKSRKCKEVGGEVCFVSRAGDTMYQVT